MSRYARQIVLPEVGEEGQARLSAARVLVAGAGGLGVPALQYLVGAGIGHITVVDPDVVEESNLHRQPMYRMADLGRPKSEAAAEVLAASNPDVALRAVVAGVDPANVDSLLPGHDLVLDCADSFAASYVLSDACLAAGVPLLSASALGLSGYAGGFCGGAPSLRAVFPELPERAGSCATAGVLGPLVGALGAMQAQMALGVVLRLSPSPLGQMVTWDAGQWRMGGFRFDTAPEPDFPLRFIARPQIRAEDMTVDLREPEEAPQMAVPGAMRISPAAFAAEMPRPAPGQRVVICCRSGLRAWKAARDLQTRWQGDIALAAIQPWEETPDETD